MINEVFIPKIFKSLKTAYMSKENEMRKVNPKELEILDILWNKNVPMTSKDILIADSNLVMSTIQSTLKKLLDKELVKVDGITYSGTVLTRTYVPTLSLEKFVLEQFPGLDARKLVGLEEV